VDIHYYLEELMKAYDCEIHIIMTAHAQKFYQKEILKCFINGNIYTDLFDSASPQFRIPHVQLTDWADIMIILPATANIIGKIANGIADDLLSTAAMAATCPVVIAPNMNENMLQKPAVQRNLQTLRDDGYFILESAEANAIQQSDGKKVKGAMPEHTTFIQDLEALLRQLSIYA
jgi:phosphopantothenoylcysteine decarboxylase/phosphopantothenate--cysteine ligase